MKCAVIDTSRWSRVYDRLLKIIKATSGEAEDSASVKLISSLLLRNAEDVFLAWIIACFVPWARLPQKHINKSSSKAASSAASAAAREGIKADNKITRIVDNAVCHLSDIIMVKDSTKVGNQITTSPLKRKHDIDDRVSQGQAVRRWGSHWRSSVMYALLTQIQESQTDTGK